MANQSLAICSTEIEEFTGKEAAVMTLWRYDTSNISHLSFGRTARDLFQDIKLPVEGSAKQQAGKTTHLSLTEPHDSSNCVLANSKFQSYISSILWHSSLVFSPRQKSCSTWGPVEEKMQSKENVITTEVLEACSFISLIILASSPQLTSEAH